MNFGIITRQPCLNTPPPADTRCNDAAFALQNPTACAAQPRLIIKPDVGLVCLFGSLQMKAFLVDTTGETDVTDQTVFSSSNPDIIVVGAISGNANATGVSSGSANINASYGGLTESAEVTVLANTNCCDAQTVAMMVMVDTSKSMSQSFNGAYSTKLMVPFIKQFHPDLVIEKLVNNPALWPLAFLPFVAFVVLVIVGSSNAVNLTDGLDGLAIGCTVIAAGALAVLTYVSGHATFAQYLELQRMPLAGELTIFCGAMVGASIGFLWYNAHPAEVFMGDVGSLALGGAIGTVAVMIKQELLLPFIGGIFVIEALSVILQVVSYKLRKKRIFKMAPLHHHFELLGWSESKIIVRFWIGSLVFALFALTTLKLR